MKLLMAPTSQIRRLIFFVSALLTCMAILVAVSISLQRSNHQEVDELYAKNIAATLGLLIATKFNHAEQLILDIADDYESGFIKQSSIEEAVSKKFGRQSFADSITVADRQGDVIFWTGGPVPSKANVSDKKYFQYAEYDSKSRIIIGNPIEGILSRNSVIPLVRRIKNRDNNFDGILIAEIEVKKIIKIFEQVDIGKNGTVSLHDNDMTIVARYSKVQGNSGPIGQNTMSDQFWSMYRKNPNEGTYTAIAAIDNVERSISYRSIQGYPFIVIVGRSKADGQQNFLTDIGIPLWLTGFIVLIAAYTIQAILKLSKAQKLILDSTIALKNSKDEIEKVNHLADQALELARCGYWFIDYGDGYDHYFSSDRTVAIFGDSPRDNYRYDIMNDWYNNIVSVDEEAARATLANYNAAVQGIVEKYDMIHPYRRPIDGRIIWIHVMGKVTRDGNGMPKYMHGVVMDITRLREMEAALIEIERIQRESAQNDMNEAQRIAQIGSYITDIKTGVWVATETCDKIFGIDGKFNHTIENWNSLVAPESREDLLKYYYEIIEDKGAFYHEYEIVRPNNGERRWVLARGEFIFDNFGNPITLRGTIEDITEKKAIFDELILHRLNLELLVKQRTAELEEAIRSRGYFFACASHDLRQPLQALSLYAHELTLQEVPEIKSLGNKIVATTNSLGRLLTGVLSVSAIDAGEMKVRTTDFDISDILNKIEIANDSVASAAAGNLTVRCISPAKGVHSDPVIVERIVRNLADNACKFTLNGKVLIGARRHDDKVKIIVQDTGPGIARDRIPLVLKEFIKGDAPMAGSGLGLSVANRFCNLLGSKLVIKSVVGKGCQFSFEIPISYDFTEVGATYNRFYSFTNDQSDVIIVIDDNVDIAKTLSDMLSAHEIKSLPAYTLEHAIELLADSALVPCGIITDLTLGANSGIDAIREIRDIFSDRDIPAIILTGSLLAVQNISSIEKLIILEKPADQGKIFEAMARLQLLSIK